MAIALASRSIFSVFKYILGPRLDRALTVIRDGEARVGCGGDSVNRPWLLPNQKAHS